MRLFFTEWLYSLRKSLEFRHVNPAHGGKGRKSSSPIVLEKEPRVHARVCGQHLNSDIHIFIAQDETKSWHFRTEFREKYLFRRLAKITSEDL